MIADKHMYKTGCPVMNDQNLRSPGSSTFGWLIGVDGSHYPMTVKERGNGQQNKMWSWYPQLKTKPKN